MATRAGALSYAPSQVWQPIGNKTHITLDVCFTDTYLDDNTQLDPSLRSWVPDAVRQWDDETWVDFVGFDVCENLDDPVLGPENVIFSWQGAGIGMGGTGLFGDWPELDVHVRLQPIATDTPEWRGAALHEFGHALGLSHDQAREDWEPRPNVEPELGNPIKTDAGEQDNNSILSYCRDRNQSTLSPADVEYARRIFGADGQALYSGGDFAIRLPFDGEYYGPNHFENYLSVNGGSYDWAYKGQENLWRLQIVGKASGCSPGGR